MTHESNQEDGLLKLWRLNICPNCGRRIPDGTRVGTGRRQDGGFCSLDCYAQFYRLELEERARRLAENAVRH